VLGVGLGALTLGAAAALGAYAVHPLALPAALTMAALATVTLRRPEVGLAAWFVLLALGTLGTFGDSPWVVSLGWAAFLFWVAMVRAPAGGSHCGGLPPAALPLLVLLVLTGTQAVLTASLGAAVPVVRVLVTGTLVFFAIALTVRSRSQVMWVLSGVAVQAAILGVVAMWEWRNGGSEVGFITDTGALVGRVTAGFGHPNALGGFLVLLVPLIAGAALLTRRWRLLFVAAAIVAVTGVYLTFSRGALLGLVAVPLVLLGFRRSLLVAPLLLVLALTLTPDLLQERFATSSVRGPEAATRVDIWRTAASIWAADPVLGAGPGSFPERYATVRVPGKQYLPSTQFEPPPHAHNLGLQALAEQGIIGLAALLAVLSAAVLSLMRARGSPQPWVRVTALALLAALVAFAVHNVFDVTLLERSGQEVWALLGLASALGRVATGESRDGE
jgi:O-antigen ligase